MKLTFLFILITSLQLSAKVYSQDAKIKLSSSQNTVGKIIDAIEEQTQFKIFYKTGQFNTQKVVSFNATELTVANALTEIFQGSGLSYKVMDKLIVLAPAADIKALTQQKITITGRVVDIANGLSLPGVSVVVKGSKTGVLTDINGNFKIDVLDKNTTLVFTFIGYIRQEIQLEGRTFLEIGLKTEVKNLDEIVIVGYGQQKKANLTGSVSSVKGEELLSRQAAQTSTLLQGVAAGVTVSQQSGQPGQDGGRINIRGIGSMMSSTSPLVLIDDVEGNINDVDPNMIESISVLKDAASTAIFGARATNGVILVKTKRGKVGKATVSYNTYVAKQVPTNLPNVLSG
ncbi:MAG: TonB-dependent receptor plug domain-containing protein, partial [Bacteroidetes bacterium]|nr:TonB-dependent receptor plug domain-containing protein [Bacteroidota bacterium]